MILCKVYDRLLVKAVQHLVEVLHSRLSAILGTAGFRRYVYGHLPSIICSKFSLLRFSKCFHIHPISSKTEEHHDHDRSHLGS
jgi:hypothetical protein